MKSVKSWIMIALPVHEETKEAIGQYLFQLGARGIEEQAERWLAYFPDDRDSSELLNELQRYLHNLNALGFSVDAKKISLCLIPERDWNEEWKKNYHGFAITEGIYIKPTWEQPPPKSYPCLIEIDPAMAFGTGTHATTRSCLQLLEPLITGGECVLDIGTGTGILAIAAIKLGARRVVAFDIDPIATKTAKKNAEQNKVLPPIELFTGTLAALRLQKMRIDIVLANVNRSEIERMMPALKTITDQSAQLIVSGILIEESEKMLTLFVQAGLEVLKMVYAEEWVTFQLHRKGQR